MLYWKTIHNVPTGDDTVQLIPPVFNNQNNIRKPTLACRLHGHRRWVRDIRWNPAARGVLCSSSGDQTIRVWDVESEYNIDNNTIPGYTVFKKSIGQVGKICWSPCGKYVCCGYLYDKFRLWDALSGECIQELACRPPLCENNTNNNNTVFGRGTIGTFFGGGSWVRSISWSSLGMLACSEILSDRVYLWDTSINSKKPRYIKYHQCESRISCIAWSGCGQVLACGTFSNYVVLLFVDLSGELVNRYKLNVCPNEKWVRCIVFAGRRLAIATTLMNVQLWDIMIPPCQTEINTLMAPVNVGIFPTLGLVSNLSLRCCGNCVAYIEKGVHPRLVVRDIRQNNSENRYQMLVGRRTSSVEWSPLGEYLSTGTISGGLYIWDFSFSQQCRRQWARVFGSIVNNDTNQLTITQLSPEIKQLLVFFRYYIGTIKFFGSILLCYYKACS